MIRMEAQCEPRDVIANRLDPWHGAHYHPHSFGRLRVIEQRGRLGSPPSGTTRDQTLGAWVTDGMPSAASWTSGDVVLTAVTDGSRVTLAAAVAALPHEGLRQPTTMERVRAGWARILGR